MMAQIIGFCRVRQAMAKDRHPAQPGSPDAIVHMRGPWNGPGDDAVHSQPGRILAELSEADVAASRALDAPRNRSPPHA
jgi:hypothetical protein